MNYHLRSNGRMPVAALIALAALMFLTAGPAAAADSKSPGKEIKEAATAISEYTVEQKDAAVAEAGEMMDSFDARMDAWQGKIEKNWGELKQGSQKKYQESVRNLRKQRNELSEWYGSMKYSSMEAWDETKQGFARTYDKVMETFSSSEKQVDTEK